MGDPFLNYLALGILFFVAIVLFCGMIAIHDIPYCIAESRHHPHQDAIHAAGWVSLFTLHALWPFLWIWAMAYQPERGWGFKATSADEPGRTELTAEVAALRRRIAHLEKLARPGDRPEVKAPVSHRVAQTVNGLSLSIKHCEQAALGLIFRWVLSAIRE